MESRKAALIIMDGWGHGKDPETSAINKADTPFVESLYKNYPNAELVTHGEKVGLPSGQMGNSEVGHMNLGAGRIVYQDLLRIDHSISNGSFYLNDELNNAFDYACKKDVNVHFIGLVSDGGVHSSLNHLKAICDLFNKCSAKKAYIHCFTDGRDTDPMSGKSHVEALSSYIEGTNIEIATIIGRYYAMDRDKRWERVKKAYDLLVNSKGKYFDDISIAMQTSYDNNVTDEFIEPILINKNAHIKSGDVVLCFNFRTDRCREITEVLTQKDYSEYHMNKIDLYYVTMTTYDKTFKNIKVIINDKDLSNTLGEVIYKNGMQQLRIAETEKYPHVSFFFSGGVEDPFEGEKRIMVQSPKVATYDLKPEMSAHELSNRTIEEIKTNKPDFICLNFANADMVGHTGVFEAAVIASQTVDQCVESVVNVALENNYTIFLTADHGNSDMMINPDGSPNTAHTKNLVPWFFISNELKPNIKDGKLSDIAPSILKFMNIEIPKEMDGDILWQE
jgi:2,3-bisphosphoglycerate-independent phosphoglycerate mutase